MIGLAALKFALFVVLPVWLIWKLCSKVWRWGSKRGGDAGPETGSPPPSTSTPGPDAA